MEEEKHNIPSQENQEKTQVCIYFIKGDKCIYGDKCKFLHEDIPEKYPECKHGINCTRKNIDCKLKHTKKPQKECHAYNAGYCPNGKNCKDLHNEKDICLNYLLGFCPQGPNCNKLHLKTMIAPGIDNLSYLAKSPPSN